MEENLNNIESKSVQVNQMVAAILGNSLSEIDGYIEKVRNTFLNSTEIADSDLDKIILQIPVYIYYLTNLCQEIDVKKGVAAENAKYTENDFLMQATGTVAEKQAKASNNSIKDRIVQLAYKGAASLIQTKMNAAMEILASAKKVQQRRLEEMRLTKMSSNSVGAF